MNPVKTFYDVIIHTLKGNVGADLTENGMEDVLAQIADENTTEVTMGETKIPKCNITNVTVGKDEYNDD